MSKCHKCGDKQKTTFEDHVTTISFLIFVFAFAFLLGNSDIVFFMFYDAFGFWKPKLIPGLFIIVMWVSFGFFVIGMLFSMFDKRE